jgi:hypothetical protein
LALRAGCALGLLLLLLDDHVHFFLQIIHLALTATYLITEMLGIQIGGVTAAGGSVTLFEQSFIEVLGFLLIRGGF